MVEYYKTNKGYCYKKTKKYGSIRISLEDYKKAISKNGGVKRKLNNVVPLKIEGSDFTRVSVSFREKRYYKDGNQESVRLIDRIFLREGKIFRIIQWMGEIEN